MDDTQSTRSEQEESRGMRGRQLNALRKLTIESRKVGSVTVSAIAIRSVLRAIDGYGVCWAGEDTIGDEVGLTGRTVRRAFQALEDLKFVVAEHRPGQTTIFKINWETILATPESISGPQETISGVVKTTTPESFDSNPGKFCTEPRKVLTVTPETVSDDTLRNVIETKEKRNTLSELDFELTDSTSKAKPKPDTSDALKDAFGEWYRIYPKKVARGAAEKAFPKSIKSISKSEKVGAAEAITLLLRWTQERLPNLNSKEKRYIPNPATWLNAESYRDEIENPSSYSRSNRPGANVVSGADYIPNRKWEI